MISNLNINERGTTLVEALVAILVLVFGIVPSLAIVFTGNAFSYSIRNSLIASNLAQEGTEVVRAIRDANWFNNQPFDTGLSDGIYRLEWSSDALLPESGNPPLKVTPTGLYNYSSGTDTTFQRRVFITKIDPAGCNCELRIIAEVTWLERSGAKTIRVESHLFNWR
jgi:Tfp pilus assembly protein PilV